jgi:hypothetical protein
VNFVFAIIENYTQICCSIALAGLGYHFAHRQGNNLYKKGIKTYNFRIKSGMYKRLIYFALHNLNGCFP